jgi:hypothetical protein
VSPVELHSLAKWPLAWGMEHGAWGMEHRVRDQGSGDGKTKLIAGSSQLKEKGEDRGQTEVFWIRMRYFTPHYEG